MISSFPPFVWVLIGSLKFLAVCAVFNRLIQSFFRSFAFLVGESEVCWKSGRFVAKLQVSVKVSTSESIDVLLWLCFWKFLRVWEFMTDWLLD